MINVLDRAVKVIICLSEGLNGVIEIANRLSLNKATVHRILQTLEMSGMVIREPVTRKYYLGPTFFSITSNMWVAHQGLVAVAFEDMWQLRETTGESVALQIKSGLQRTLLEELESRQSYRYSLGRDYSAPLYTGSGGVVMLAQMPQKELESILNGLKIIKTGPGAVKDKKELIAEIEKAREQGYAISTETAQVGTAGISVPVAYYYYPVALSVFGPKNRLDSMILHIEEIKERGIKISNRVSQILNKRSVENEAGDG